MAPTILFSNFYDIFFYYYFIKNSQTTIALTFYFKYRWCAHFWQHSIFFAETSFSTYKSIGLVMEFDKVYWYSSMKKKIEWILVKYLILKNQVTLGLTINSNFSVVWPKLSQCSGSIHRPNLHDIMTKLLLIPSVLLLGTCAGYWYNSTWIQKFIFEF